ncbi:MAG: FHA domain-containing protein [Streptosporangiaceae bacterium]
MQDLGSTNGTRLNGWRVSSLVPVRAGDQVSFGAAGFVLADGR